MDQKSRSPHTRSAIGDFGAFIASHACRVRERLEIFLETIDRCDVLFLDTEGTTMVFGIAAYREEHLALIAGALAQDGALLAELGIDRHDVDLRGELIRVRVPVPEPDAIPHN